MTNKALVVYKAPMPITLGKHSFESPVFLAPMSGVTDVPFRRMVRKFGAPLVSSEMIASRVMLDDYTRAKTKPHYAYNDEFPLSAQIAGCEPEVMAEVAKINEQNGAAIIDINFGCPVKKVVNNMAGSALMRDEPLAVAIMDAVVKAVNIPVTVKMRLGWDDTSINAPRLAKMAQDVGVQMITVHGRTRNQLYNGNANWDAVAAVKDAVDIPVIVNGDILCADDAKTAMEKSGADGVMIGRGAYGRPWIVEQISRELNGEVFNAPSNLSEIILEHYDLLLSYYGDHVGNITSRKHIGLYVAGMAVCYEFRGEINTMSNTNQIREIIHDYFEKNEPQRSQRTQRKAENRVTLASCLFFFVLFVSFVVKK